MAKLGDFVKITPGANNTRLKRQIDVSLLDYYDQTSFENDLIYQPSVVVNPLFNPLLEDVTLVKGDIVFSHSLQQFAIVGGDNAGKVIGANFTRIEVIDGNLDDLYLVYLFNASNVLRRQKERELRGSGITGRIPVSVLKELEIPLPSFEEQRKIGLAYQNLLILQTQLNQYQQRMENFVLPILELSLQSCENERK